jgi:hypothetical protein
MKWLLIVAVVVAVALGLLAGSGFDDMEADVQGTSEDTPAEKSERLPIPPASE